MRSIKQRTVKSLILPAMAALTITAATPVMAADYLVREPVPRAAVVVPGQVVSGPLTLQDALAVAAGIGVVRVTDTHFDDGEWNIEGRDGYGKWIQVDVDARTGEVRNVDRSII
jgi:hypothetical protein